MNEWLMILSTMLGVGLFAAGGTDIPSIGGQKWLRRYLLPACLGGIALLSAEWWTCIGYAVTLSAFLHLGYGDRCSWLKRAFIFTGYGFSALCFGWTWWAVATPILCSLAFLLSNIKGTASMFFWKCVEMLFGFLIAITFINAMG